MISPKQSHINTRYYVFLSNTINFQLAFFYRHDTAGNGPSGLTERLNVCELQFDGKPQKAGRTGPEQTRR